MTSTLVRQVRNKGFKILKSTPADRKEILRLMQDVFFKTDPSSVYSKVSENPYLSSTMQELSLESLDDNLSFVAKEKESDKAIIGVSINGVRPINLRSNHMDVQLKKVSSKREKTLLELWRFISMMPPNPELYFKNVKELFELRFIAVDPVHRNKGIATALVNSSMKEAVNQGMKYLRVDCTSHFTARIASAYGMDCIYEINYSDYKNPSGEHVFQNIIFPHTKITVYAGEITVK